MPSLYDLSYAVRPQAEGVDRRLYPYQQAAVEQVLNGQRRHILLGHHPGAGKTPMALAIAKVHLDLGGGVTIVCPPALTYQWGEQAYRWVGPEQAPAIQIIPDSKLHYFITRPRDGELVIIDEVHRFKDRASRRTRALFGGLHQCTRYPGLTTGAAHIVALTGTPVIASPVDIFPLLRVMGLPCARTFTGFCERYCPPYQTLMRVGRGTVRETKYDRTQNLDELSRILRETVIIRPSRQFYLDQLPAITSEVFRIDICDPASEAGIGDEDVGAPGDNPPPALAAVRRETGHRKAITALPYLRTLTEGGARPLIWCWHRDVAENTATALGVPFLHGGLSLDERATAVAAFHQGRGLVATLAAAGTGLDGLQHITRTCVFVEEAFTPAENEQGLARIHRTGQTNPVHVIYIRASCLADRIVERANATKTRNAEGTLQ